MVKLYQVVDDIIPCIEKPKDTTEGVMGLINKPSKTAGYKTNT